MQDTATQTEPCTRLVPLTAWPGSYPWPSVAALRDLVFRADTTGFDAGGANHAK